MDLVVGTAGHIDHGKTALVKALTGVDADRLPEERKRGITIDLGFADLQMADNRISFVDVPGHERFVKNMLAGAGGIDLVLLVVAGDEGVMPQTREHFEICRLLETRRGVVALTKSDLSDPEFLDLVELDVAELVEGSFLEEAPVVRVSAKTGAGIEDLKKAIADAAASLPDRERTSAARIPVDRSFAVKGFGTVITGTLLSGEISVGDEMEVLPSGKRVRIRGLQTHGDSVEKAGAGRRTAVNLGGVDHDEVPRGVTIAEPGSLSVTQILDAEIELLADAGKPLRSRQRVRVHLGTAELLARVDVLNEQRQVEPGTKELIQLRLEAPAAAAPFDRFIIRKYSPQTTIAGGRVLNAAASKHKRKEIDTVRESLREIAEAQGDPEALVAAALRSGGTNGIDAEEAFAWTGLRKEIVQSALNSLAASGAAVAAGKKYVFSAPFASLRSEIEKALEAHHAADPLSPGMKRETLREQTGAYIPEEVFRTAVEQLESEGRAASEKDVVRLASHSRDLAPEAAKVLERLSEIYSAAGLEVPTLRDALDRATAGTGIDQTEARKIFQMLVESSEVLKVSEEFYFARESIRELTARIRKFADEVAENRLISVPEFKDVAGVSRKYAIPLLEYFDAIKVTRRAGDKRLIMKES